MAMTTRLLIKMIVNMSMTAVHMEMTMMTMPNAVMMLRIMMTTTIYMEITVTTMTMHYGSDDPSTGINSFFNTHFHYGSVNNI